jgi:hypothetical protein
LTGPAGTLPRPPGRTGLGMNWESFIKRYIWDDDRTPYLVRVDRITRRQADYEIYVDTVFLGVLFAAVTVVALAGGLPQGRSEAVALYGFSVVCATILFGATKHLWPALYCSAVPLAALFQVLTRGLPPHLGTIDHVVLIVVALLVLRYSMRVVSLAKAYPGLPESRPDA